MIRLVELAWKGSIVGAVKGCKFSILPVMLGIGLLQLITIAPGSESVALVLVLALVPVFAALGAVIGCIIGLLGGLVVDARDLPWPPRE